MSETGASTSRSRTGLRFRERFSKLVKRPSSVSGKSHLNVPELSTRDSSSVLSIRSSRSDGGNTTTDNSLGDKAALSLTKTSTAELPRFDVSTGDVSSATTSMNSHVTQMWQRALEAVMRDEEVKEAAILFESLLSDYMKQEKAVSTQPKSSSEHEPKNVEDALRLVDRTLQDGTKAQQALDTTLGVFAVVKGLSSFVGSMLSECPPAALAWAGVCACIPIISAPLEQHQSMIKGLRHVYARAPIYFDLTGNLLQDGAHSCDLGNSIRTNIQPLYEGILKYIMLSICSIHRGKFSRFWKAISGQAQWESLLDNIAKAEEEFIAKHTNDPRFQTAGPRRRNEYLHKLKGMDYQTRLKTTRRRLDGTCQWFRQHPGFRDWLDTDGGLLLVSASASCGKSVLAKYLIEELLHEEDASATVCYFFFKDSDPQARSCVNASKAILHGFLKSNLELVDTCMKKLPIITDNISNTELWSAFDRLSRVQGAGSIICVLDALDECDLTERDGFVNSLKDYVIKNHSKKGAKFIVTTRGYPQIVNLFTNFSSNKIHLDGDSDEEKRQIQKEISIVMEHRLNKLETTMPDIGPATLDIIRTGLIENSTEQRTYLWMHLMFDYIRKNRFCTREEWREIFRNPPDTVDRTYEGLLQSVTPQAKERVRTLLALILAAERPLTIAELSTAVNCRINTLESRIFDLDDIPDEKEFGSWIRWECGSFVTIYEGQAFLIHQTAKEFLLEPTETENGWWQGSMTEYVIHQYMAESCISFISLRKFQQQEYVDYVQAGISNLKPNAEPDMDLPMRIRMDSDTDSDTSSDTSSYTSSDADSDTNSDAYDDGRTEELCLEPFVVYSAVTWMYHFRRCQQSGLSNCQVTDVGKEFFDLYLSSSTLRILRRNHLGNLYDNSFTALHLSVQNEKRILATLHLIHRKAKLVHAVDDFGNTPLHTATLANNVLGMRVLLYANKKAPSDYNCKGESGDTPLHMACRMGYRAAVKVLVEAGADPYIRNDDGLTAMDIDRPPRLGVRLARLFRKRNIGTVYEEWFEPDWFE
ncbi:Vegetative incompatibility protein HET-E-1 [Colletotrichum viniferum]|nr:Vegetative incompatibility protein HET-E-1 [Colletotrichum viniferum]